MIYVLDCEESSLRNRSFPIEIAWVDQEGRGERHPIRPAPGWLGTDGTPLDRDPDSECLHGISFAMLVERGGPLVPVAARVASILGTQTAMVWSDAPQADGTWIGCPLLAAGMAVPVGILDVLRLYRQSRLPPRRVLPAGGVARERAQQRIVNPTKEIMAAAEAAEHVAPAMGHRALPVAQRLWRTWRAVQQAAAQRIGDEPPR